MSSVDVLPSTDNARVRRFEQFAALLDQAPETYGLSADDAARMSDAARAYRDAHFVSGAEYPRSRENLVERDAARARAEELYREIYDRVRLAPGVPGSTKLALGVRPPGRRRKPVECPQSAPILTFRACTRGYHRLSYSDSNNPDSRARPEGATELQLFVALGDGPGPLSDARFLQKVTRNPFVVEYGMSEDGVVATYYGRWASRRGECGPWSAPLVAQVVA